MQDYELTSPRKRLGVQAWFMHRRFVGADLPTCIVAVPALAVRTFEVTWVSRGRVDVRLAEKTGCLYERERELAQHREDAEDEVRVDDATEMLVVDRV